MENSNECGHCAHGQGFTRGLMLWCAQEKLPLDFVSWQEGTIDATHSNVWNDPHKAGLTETRKGTVNGISFAWEKTLDANSVTLVELKR